MKRLVVTPQVTADANTDDYGVTIAFPIQWSGCQIIF